MAEEQLTQTEADALIAIEKGRVDDKICVFPELGGSETIPLISNDKREHFFLDISRGRIDLNKGTYQNRGRQIVILVRLDFGEKPHRNPDDSEILSPHLHLYREGYGDKWAFPVPTEKFPNLADLWQTFQDFMQFCNVTNPPRVERGLFT